tara:strand:+ start:2628 stop:2885 length:258 start_codon:yes stop_codon:yes gene_type:complete
MTYRELLAGYGIHIFDAMTGREFTAYQLANGWAWWGAQPFASEGLVREKSTGDFYRLTSTTEMRGRLKYRIYSIGPAIDKKSLEI